MGKESANNFMEKLEAAQKAGVHAMKWQQVAKWSLGALGLGAAGEMARDFLP